MSWTSPNLLDRIFSAKPFDPTQYDSLGNFLSGYAGGVEQRKQSDASADETQMIDDMAGGPSTYKKPSWLAETIKGVYLGKSMQDPLKYQQANLQNKMLAARGIGETLQNRQQAFEIDQNLEAETQKAEWQEKYGNSPEAMLDAPTPSNSKAAAWVAKAKHDAGETWAGAAIASDKANWFKDFGQVDEDTRSILGDMIPNKNGTPSPQMREVMRLGKEKVRNRQLAEAEERSLTSASAVAASVRADVQVDVARMKNETMEKIARMRIDAATEQRIAKGFDFLPRALLKEYDARLGNALKIKDLKESTAEIDRISKEMENKFPSQAAPAASANTPVQINSQAEYDAFEGGAYIDSTGKKAFKKPKSAP